MPLCCYLRDGYIMMTCISPVPFTEHKEMRLVNGGRRCEGRVEVWYNGTWGTVCSEKLYREEAEVICKQLECGPLAYIDYRGWKYGQGSGPIWIDEMKCSSHESALWQCQFDPWGQHNCDHREDAGVSCKGNTGKSAYDGRLNTRVNPSTFHCSQQMLKCRRQPAGKTATEEMNLNLAVYQASHSTTYTVSVTSTPDV